MNPATLIQNMAADGLRLSVTPAGKIKAAGEQATVNRWLPVLKDRKAEIIAALVDADFQDAYQESAALIEANGVPREWAEGFATLCTLPRPAPFTPKRWQQLVDDGGLFLDLWGKQAAAPGW